ncbi:hypothetical protein GC105_14880 [Alkalibaculum sp. M08DMB]|uniref:Uncharacterized protein n=1 Tax=Alkalibaculum sporogenes TaxID=2655001 RepID=A0A6A7KCI8_9FIRM|nr:hypothetical protein [Alkalibaculum sporogenes]MPW27065.1 hypothetical protein [Alkalibaculum sporogenes]
MFFSERFKVDSDLIKAYGAVDISLVCDIPLFIDPMLIFNSDKYQSLHQEIIRYFHFLFIKSKEGLSTKEIDAWFNFSEVPNNWLGYSLIGNKGLALGRKFAKFLYNNIGFALNTKSISKSQHIEKAMLLYEGSGKDKVSDLTVNLIKRFLCEYTEDFAKEHIDPDLCQTIPVDKAYFNYETESFVSREYTLPFLYNSKGKIEYVLLTPYDILREDEPSINREDFYKSHERIRAAIENDTLRAYVNNYIGQAVRQYEENQKRSRRAIRENSIQKVEKNAFQEIVREYPELYDYYIKLQEANTDEIKKQCMQELNKQLEKLMIASKNLISLFVSNEYVLEENLSAREEAKKRLAFFKYIIEDCDGYKNLFVKGQQIAKENDLQRLFRFVWHGSNYKIDSEPNNGRGQADFIVSMGQRNQNIIEFKLASNSTLRHVFTQVKIYEAANCTDGSLIAIFYFSESEYQIARQVVINAGHKDAINKSIFLIDCRNDNKASASIA